MAEAHEVLKAQLVERKEQLARELEASREAAPSGVTESNEPSYGNHLADQGTTTYQQEENLAIETHLARQIESIEETIARIENGTYGRCEDCGGPIGEERLQVLPTATLCISCQARREGRRGGK